MAEVEQKGLLGRSIDWIAGRLPPREVVAATTVLGFGWGMEYSAKSERVDLAAFGATAKTDVLHNSGWDARLGEVALTVLERGNYTAEILRNGEAIQTQRFAVTSEPAFVHFKNVEPRGGLGGAVVGDPFNFGYGYSNHIYEVRMTKEQEGMSPKTITAKI